LRHSYAFLPSSSIIKYNHDSSQRIMKNVILPVDSRQYQKQQSSRMYGTNDKKKKNNNDKKIGTKTKNRMTVKEIVEEVTRANEQTMSTKGKKYRRTRKRVDAPKQTYVYAAQKREMKRKGLIVEKIRANNEDENQDESDSQDTTQIRIQLNEDSPISVARKLGMNPAMQSCHPSFALHGDKTMIPVEEPKIVGEIRVGLGESQTGMYAYIIEKPPGWTILEGKKRKEAKQHSKQESKERIDKNQLTKDEDKVSKDKKKQLKYYDEVRNEEDFWELDMEGFDLSSVMTPEELEELEQEGGFENFSYGGTISSNERSVKIEDESKSNNDDTSVLPAIFLSDVRPSVVSWLKQFMTSKGKPIRGGKNWKAIAGAVETDDSGLVVLCPKENVENIFVDSAEYFAVIGNGQYLAPKGKKARQNEIKMSEENVKFEIYAKLRKGRGSDIVTTSKVTVRDGASNCNDVVHICQQKYLEGVRGDPEANPIERRANRRLIHCSFLTVSSLTHDDSSDFECDIPDDIRVFSERRNHHEFKKGSFLGRSMLGNRDDTTAYREINGAADGWPGWIVDRYNKWLLVQHDEMYPKGPLPSLHDGYTAGVYYFASDPDRSITGSVKGIKPILLEGQPAPEMFEVRENGIKYLVNFEDLSTGIFLDQRFQRAWLARCCTDETRVLNCFAHCGAFSIAAATAGAHTTSLDLDKKWLDRIEQQLKINGIDTSKHHDSIYGDCK